MKKFRWGIFLSLSAVLLALCSCTRQDAPESTTVTDTETEIKQTAAVEENKEYRELFDKYKECNEQYFKNTEAAVNTLLGQRYAYAITAYEHSRTLSEIAEMFFDDISENTLNIYFALRGFEDKEYTVKDTEAEYKCKKKEDEYVYRVSYDTDKQSFEIVLYVNGELKDSFKCEMSDGTLTKNCYSGTLQRTFISRVNKDGTSKIEWYDDHVENVPETDDEDHGYVVYDGIALSGVIK